MSGEFLRIGDDPLAAAPLVSVVHSPFIAPFLINL